MASKALSKEKKILYFQLAQKFAAFSKDPSTKVGAVFIASGSHQILSTGYNGFPRGINEKDLKRWQRPGKYKLVEHAERNCIYNAARNGTSLEGGLAFVTLYPCCDCARGIIQSGIKKIVTTVTEDAKKRWGEDWKISNYLFEEAGVEVEILTDVDINQEIDLTINVDE